MRIVISSAGRRVYLVRWFQKALAEAGIVGEVIVTENDPNAAAVAASDRFWKMPNYCDERYSVELLRMANLLKPDLFISLNDYELSLLSEGLAQELRNIGVCVPVLEQNVQHIVSDKYEMSRKLVQYGISTPETSLLSDTETVDNIIERSKIVIIKDRFGSGSSGFRRMSQLQAQRWFDSIHSASNPSIELSRLVIQPFNDGDEYGVDIITPLSGGPPQGVFARKKLAMRHGETSAAVTVSPERFITTANNLANILDSRGIIDVDILVKGDETSVIDVNPRFGGGYPFVHLAGTDVPSYFVNSIARQDMKSGWNEYTIGLRVAKHEGLIGFVETGSSSG